MEKEKKYIFEILIIAITMIVVMLLRLKMPYVFNDGKLPIIWVGVGIGSFIGELIRKEKRYAGVILPILLVINYFLYKVNLYIPAYIIILMYLATAIVYYSLSYRVRYKYFSSILAVTLLIAFFLVNYNAYNKRILKDINFDYIVKKELELKGSISKSDLRDVESIILFSRYTVNSIEGIENFESLKSLGIWNNTYLIKDLERISSLKELERLVLWYADLEKLSEIKKMDSVKRFELIYPRKGKLPPMTFFPNLEVLEIQGLNLQSLDALKDLEAIDYLSIADGQVISFDGIEELQSLKTLSMYKLHISNIDKIFELKNLQKIKLEDMSIPFRDEFDKRAKELGIIIEEFNSMTLDDILEEEVNEFNNKTEP